MCCTSCRSDRIEYRVWIRLARRERAQLLVEAPARPALQAFLTDWSRQLWALRPPRELRWHLDVDPAEV